MNQILHSILYGNELTPSIPCLLKRLFPGQVLGTMIQVISLRVRPLCTRYHGCEGKFTLHYIQFFHSDESEAFCLEQLHHGNEILSNFQSKYPEAKSFPTLYLRL